MNEQLSEMMLYTGIRDTRSFDPSVLYMRDGLQLHRCD